MRLARDAAKDLACTPAELPLHQSCSCNAPELQLPCTRVAPEFQLHSTRVAPTMCQHCSCTAPKLQIHCTSVPDWDSQCCILHHMLHTLHSMLQSALQCRTLQMNCTFNAIFLTRTHTHNFRSWMNCHYNAIVHDRIVCSPW